MDAGDDGRIRTVRGVQLLRPRQSNISGFEPLIRDGPGLSEYRPYGLQKWANMGSCGSFIGGPRIGLSRRKATRAA
ncbi:unnamed protein product [Dovyalis caffra]|uniref:Uncharacterized protein n=1 Tax=Dovyalis caffra TaxID=77055 RepID=A0AAV1S2F1_9ROSI|nr:unnamed protein product [Dovyalis caffra]